MPDQLTPEQITAAIRDPNSGAMPTRIGVNCDNCRRVVARDFLVREDSTREERFAVARSHLAENEGWSCGERGDYCPACVTILPGFAPGTEHHTTGPRGGQ